MKSQKFGDKIYLRLDKGDFEIPYLFVLSTFSLSFIS